MKLLLTSAGLTNKTITDKFIELIGNSPDQTKIAYIPTAANVEEGDKSWLVDDMQNVRKNRFESFDIVDISALNKERWLPRIEAVDAIIMGGGNTYHLSYWLQRSGLKDELPKFLENRVYMGVSAGSCVTSKEIDTPIEGLFEGEVNEFNVSEGLGFVDFQIVPHFNSKYFNNLRSAVIFEAAKKVDKKVYAIDDQSAIVVEDGEIEIISEGAWEEYD